MKSVVVLLLVLICAPLRAQVDSVTKLLDDPGIPVDDVEQVFDYLENTSLQSDSTVRYHLRSRLIDELDADLQRGATEAFTVGGPPYFKGTPDEYRNRIWLTAPRFSAALSLEKKPWETSIADRIAGYLALRSPLPVTTNIRLEQAVIGNFATGFGSGLLFGDMKRVDKKQHASVLPVERGLRGSLSNDPYFSQFGGAATIGIGDNVSATALYSHRALDARVNGDSILTLYEFADHRTDAELAMKNAATLSLTGARIAAFNSDSAPIAMAAGASAYHGSYDHYYDGTISNPFFGRAFDAASIDASAMTDKWRLQSEAAVTADDTMRRTMYVLEASYHPSTVVRAAAAYRHIPYGIVSPFGRLFGKPLTSLTNEDGYYLGVDAVILSKQLAASAYADIASELLPIGDEFPRQKFDYQLALHSTFERLKADLTVRDQRGQSTLFTDDSTLASLSTQTLKTMTSRLDVRDSVSKPITLFARIQNVISSNDSAHTESGWMAKLACNYQFESRPIEATAAVARFTTPSYRSAVWLYENQSQGAGRFLALYGNGYYFSLSLQLHLSWLHVTVAASEVSYDAPRLIGSGLAERYGDTSGQFVAQADLLF